MARMFYNQRETQDKLGIDQFALMDLVRAGQLQEFRDRDKMMFKADQVDLLADHNQRMNRSIFDLEEEVKVSDDLDSFSLHDDKYRLPPILNEDETLGTQLLDELYPPFIDYDTEPRSALFEIEPEEKIKVDPDEELFVQPEKKSAPKAAPKIPQDPEENQQYLKTDEAIFVLKQIDASLALNSTLDNTLLFRARKKVFGTEDDLTVSHVKERLNQAREIVLLSISRVDRPAVGDLKATIEDLKLARVVFVAEAFKTSVSGDLDSETTKRLDRIEELFAQRVH